MQPPRYRPMTNTLPAQQKVQHDIFSGVQELFFTINQFVLLGYVLLE